MWPPEHEGYGWRRKRIAGEHLGASLLRWGSGEDARRWFRLGDAVDYWDGVEER